MPPVAEIVRRWHLVPRVFYLKILCKAADSLVTRVSLGHLSRQTGPIDSGCRSNMGLTSIGRKVCKAA